MSAIQLPRLHTAASHCYLKQRGRIWYIWEYDQSTRQCSRISTGTSNRESAERKLAEHIVARKYKSGVHPESIGTDFPEINIWPIEALQQLTDGEEVKGPGVYFLWLGATLVYIGQSSDVRCRIEQHCINRTGVLGRVWGRVINFDRSTGIAVPWPYQLAVEAVYLRAYHTPENRKR